MSRRSGSVRVSRDKVLGVVAALACLAFSAIGLRVNEPREMSIVNGLRNETITLLGGQLTVGEVLVGTALTRNGEVESRTNGMFVSVETTLAAPGPQPVNLSRSRPITQTRTYDNWTNGGINAETGFTKTLDLVFEVDSSQIDDLTLEIWEGAVFTGFPQHDRIHLGITADNAAAWRRAARGESIEPDIYGTEQALP